MTSGHTGNSEVTDGEASTQERPAASNRKPLIVPTVLAYCEIKKARRYRKVGKKQRQREGKRTLVSIGKCPLPK